MGMALRMAKDLIEDKEIIPSKGYRPAVVLVSDGAPNDDWEGPMNDFISGGRSSKCERFAMAIGIYGTVFQRNVVAGFQCCGIGRYYKKI